MNEPTPTTKESLDLAPIREQLNLPADAPEADIIAAMLSVIAAMDAKYQELLASSAKAEDEIANRALADYNDIIPEDALPFWRDNLFLNRDATLAALDGLREAMKPAAPAKEPAPAAPDPTPLRNRVAAIRPKPVSAVIEPTAGVDATRAAIIRNRAHAIKHAEGVPYIVAFARAEKETPSK
jgi:hypothetical protein